MRSTKAVVATFCYLPDIPHKISGERWLCLPFHSSSGERATLIGYDDVALAAAKSVGIKAKRTLEYRMLFIGRRRCLQQIFIGSIP
jgi:hypothetical protein